MKRGTDGLPAPPASCIENIYLQIQQIQSHWCASIFSQEKRLRWRLFFVFRVFRFCFSAGPAPGDLQLGLNLV
jgi:hypothetical protein